jgi:putative ATPase
VIYMAVAPKSNAGYKAYNTARAHVGKDASRPVPEHLRNAPTKLMKELGYGKTYHYAHDEPEAYAAGENHLSEGMAEPGWYHPAPHGLEGLAFPSQPACARNPGFGPAPQPSRLSCGPGFKPASVL